MAIINLEPTMAATFACLLLLMLSPVLSTLFEINAGTFEYKPSLFETMAPVNALLIGALAQRFVPTF